MLKSNSSKNLNSYYVLTAFGGINLPRFAIFVTFLTIFVKIAIPANRGKPEHFMRKNKHDVDTLLFARAGFIVRDKKY